MSITSLDLDPSPDVARFRRRITVASTARELWQSAPLIRSLAERELRARYKQALLGASWAVITPLALMVVFSLFFTRVANVETGDVPYPVFAYLGLIPWSFFSTSMSQGGLSLLLNAPLLNKVYCPREVFPISSVGVASVDSTVAVGGLLALLLVYRVVPQPTSVWVPVLLAVQVMFTLGVTIAVSAVVLYFRDLRHALPLLLQLGLFATPVAYGLETVPSGLRPIYSALNPLAPVIDGYRRTVLYGQAPQGGLLALAAATSLAVLVGSYVLFKRLEVGFADIA